MHASSRFGERLNTVRDFVFSRISSRTYRNFFAPASRGGGPCGGRATGAEALINVLIHISIPARYTVNYIPGV